MDSERVRWPGGLDEKNWMKKMGFTVTTTVTPRLLPILLTAPSPARSLKAFRMLTSQRTLFAH